MNKTIMKEVMEFANEVDSESTMSQKYPRKETFEIKGNLSGR